MQYVYPLLLTYCLSGSPRTSNMTSLAADRLLLSSEQAAVHDVHDLTEGSNFGAFSAVCWYPLSCQFDAQHDDLDSGMFRLTMGLIEDIR